MNEYRGMVAIKNAVLSNIHPPGQCWGEHCVIHNPSAHPLREAPLYAVGQTLYRACEHLDRKDPAGTGLHTDPDHEAWALRGATRYVGWVSPIPHPCCSVMCCRLEVEDD